MLVRQSLQWVIREPQCKLRTALSLFRQGECSRRLNLRINIFICTSGTQVFRAIRTGGTKRKIMTNEERWDAFIVELRAYIEEHSLGPSKHTSLYNQCRYFKRKLREGALSEEKAMEFERVLSMRDLSIHTGGRKKTVKP